MTGVSPSRIGPDTLDLALSRLGRPPANPGSAHLVKQRSWATVWRLTTGTGTEFVKVTGPLTRYEAILVPALARRDPARVVRVLAADAQAGCLITADAGPLLRERGSRFDPPVWQAMLTRYGELQRTASPLVDDLLAVGVPDERPEQLPDVLVRLLTDSAWSTGLTATERRRLLIGLDLWRDTAVELAALGVPASVQHGDLHPGNVAIGPDGTARFFDFGDASVAHPFTVLGVPLRAARTAGAGDDEVERLVGAYLEVFSDLAPATGLRRGADLALRCAPLLRATAWDRALATAQPGHGWGEPVLENLRELLPPRS